jgi:hypothetical protein
MTQVTPLSLAEEEEEVVVVGERGRGRGRRMKDPEVIGACLPPCCQLR